MESDNPYVEILESNVKVFQHSQSDRYLRINCPWCEENIGKVDTKGHCYFYLDSDFAHCFRCYAHKGVIALFRKLGLTLPTRYDNLPADLLQKKFNETLAAKSSARLGRPPELELPEGTIPLTYLSEKVPPHRRILTTLNRWNLKFNILEELRWGWCRYMNSFIFPVYDDMDRLVYWSSRNLLGTSRQSASTDFAKYGICGELWHPLQKSVNTVYLVEGPKDAAALIQERFWGVYLFGHQPNPAQIVRLNALPHKKVFILDADVTAQARDLSERLGWSVFFLPSGDPADYAGQMTETLAKLWEEQSEDARERRFAELRQQLDNPQVHRKLKK